MAGTFVLIGLSTSDSGLSWIKENDFEESQLFSEMVSDDITHLKRFAVLLNTFEGQGDEEPSLDKMIVSAQTSSGGITYTMSDLLILAERFGYFMDEQTHLVSYESPGTEPTNYELTLIYKEYDPYYLERLPYGPTRGLTDIKSLSLDALEALVEYYNLKAVYDTELTNFNYQVLLTTDEDVEFSLENNSFSSEEVQSFGKYLTVTSNGTVETNIDPQPQDVLETANGYEFSADGDDVLKIGIDTTYIFNDRYKEGQDNLNANRNQVILWLIVMVLSAIIGIISFVFWIRGLRPEDRTELKMDRIPLEALIFLCALFSAIIYFILRYLLNNIFLTLFSDSEESYVRIIVRVALVWLCSLPIISSLYRRGINGGCFKYSLISGIFNVLSENDLGNAAWEAAKGYIFFTVINVLLTAFVIFCLLMSGVTSSYTYDIAMYVGIILLIVFDIFVYFILFRRANEKGRLRRAIKSISEGATESTHLNEKDFSEDRLSIATDLNNISQGLKTAVDEQVKADRLRTDLITNVSHDIRTPLTSIINYVDLLKRENVCDPKLKEYIDVLDQKSGRLKKLIEDLLEASRASSGNISLDMQLIDIGQLAAQALGELADKFLAKKLELELDIPKKPIYVMADGRYLWRVFENLYNNAAKYSLEGTRVYVDVTQEGKIAKFTIKNISSAKLNISPDELTERFVRGDLSRNTEGSGLGLSIAQSLTKLMKGELQIEIDGDLYKASVLMNIAEPEEDKGGGNEKIPEDVFIANEDEKTTANADSSSMNNAPIP